MNINTIDDFRRVLDDSQPFPIFFICADGSALSFKAAIDHQPLIETAIHEPEHRHDQWRVVAAQINWEDQNLICDVTGRRIKPVYAIASQIRENH